MGSKSEGRHEGGTRDPRRDHVRIPKEIVLIPESARAEFLADHERVPEKNRGLESVLEGAQRGTFRARNGAQWGSPRGRRRRVTSNRRPLPCQGSSRLPTSSDLFAILLTCSALAELVKTGQSPSMRIPATFSRYTSFADRTE